MIQHSLLLFLITLTRNSSVKKIQKWRTWKLGAMTKLCIQKFMCWNPNLQYLIMWLYWEIETLERLVKMTSLGALTSYDWFPHKMKRLEHAGRHYDNHEEEWLLWQAKERNLMEINTTHILTLDFHSPELWKKFCYWSYFMYSALL
jgi:hypothetical protein